MIKTTHDDVSWFEDESFWEECYAFLFPEERFEVAGEEVRQLLSLLDLSSGAVLDLCCGPGRHAVALAKCGLRVTGVDSTEYLLEKARQRAADADVAIEFVSADMRRFARPQIFDCVLNMYSSFGYFENAADDTIVLRAILNNLRPGGVCLIDMASKASLLRSVAPIQSSREPDGTRLVQRHEILDGGARQSIEWRFDRHGEEKVFKFYSRIFSGGELKTLMLDAGFSSVTLYGDLDARAYGKGGDRLIAVGHKAGQTERFEANASEQRTPVR